MDPEAIRPVDELLSEHDRSALPESWTGGEAYHSGGGIWIREFIDEDRHLRVIYSLSENQPGVGVERIKWDDTYEQWLPDEVIDSTSDATTDSEKFGDAIEFMEEL